MKGKGKSKADTSDEGTSDEGRLRAAGGIGKRGTGRREEADKPKKAAASDKPKLERPPSAFFIFFQEFSQEYEAHHLGHETGNKESNLAVSKAAAAKWGEMTKEERKGYEDRAGKMKEDYDKAKAQLDKQSDDDE